jgi:hypothetical protein
MKCYDKTKNKTIIFITATKHRVVKGDYWEYEYKLTVGW